MQRTSSLTLRVSVKCAILTRERYNSVQPMFGEAIPMSGMKFVVFILKGCQPLAGG